MSILLLSKTLSQRVTALLRAQTVGGWWSTRGSDLAAGTQSPAVTYQDAYGATPAVAIADPVGLWLDRRQGATTLAGPGLHLSQGTAAARPKKSARVNLHTKTSLLTAANGWLLNGAPTITSDPDVPAGQGFSNSTKIVSTGTFQGPYQNIATIGAPTTKGVWLKGGAGGEVVGISDSGNTGGVVTLTASWTFYTKTWTAVDGSSGILISAAGATVYVAGIQTNLGSVALRHQWCDTATSYDTSGFTVALNHDGTDDGLASATVVAGAVGTPTMDRFTLIRRNSAAGLIAAFQAAAGTKYLGSMTSGGAGAASGLAGTPTFLVDGVAVAGGTATTEGQLDTAMTVGPWHLLEIHNADLSAWTATATGYFSAGYPGGHDLGEDICIPAQSDANRALIRRYMGSFAGLSL